MHNLSPSDKVDNRERRTQEEHDRIEHFTPPEKALNRHKRRNAFHDVMRLKANASLLQQFEDDVTTETPHLQLDGDVAAVSLTAQIDVNVIGIFFQERLHTHEVEKSSMLQ